MNECLVADSAHMVLSWSAVIGAMSSLTCVALALFMLLGAGLMLFSTRSVK